MVDGLEGMELESAWMPAAPVSLGKHGSTVDVSALLRRAPTTASDDIVVLPGPLVASEEGTVVKVAVKVRWTGNEVHCPG